MMTPDVADKLSETRDVATLVRAVLAMCEPFGPVHSFKMVHNRGAARVACFIELESPKLQPALERTLGARSVNGAACLDIRVRKDFGGHCKVVALPVQQSSPQQATHGARVAN